MNRDPFDPFTTLHAVSLFICAFSLFLKLFLTCIDANHLNFVIEQHLS